jgi:sporulation protein YlmC with PRC-barrel domain
MFWKKTDIISGKVKNLDGFSKLSKHVGKKVYSKRGDFVGYVQDVMFKGNIIQGILVNGKRNLFIGNEFVEHESDKAFVLSIDPVVSIIGKQVFDSSGKRIGKIVDIKRKTNANVYSEIIVKKSFFRRTFSIPKEDISVAKENVILKGSL